MEERRRILIIRPSALGDVCRSVHLAVSLRNAWPSARIEWLVNAQYADAVRCHPCVDETLLFHRGRRSSSKSGSRLSGISAESIGPFALLARQLRSRRYDIVIDAQGLARSGLLSLASGAAVRIVGHDAREGASLAANRRPVHGEGCTTHTVDAMASLLDPIGIEPVIDLRLTAPPETERTHRFETPPAVLAPTSLWPGKRWPIDRFAAVAARLRDRVPVAIVGGPNERDQCAELLAVPGVIDLVGKTSVGELMRIIQRGALVIANDSAALHMAVGFDRPIVALFGPTRTERVGPYGRSDDVIQHISPGDTLDHKNEAAGRELMGRISIDEVIQAAEHRLRSS
ncbi:MAG: glycosyltransferase family 9 protein [Planctomycetota bacterium]